MTTRAGSADLGVRLVLPEGLRELAGGRVVLQVAGGMRAGGTERAAGAAGTVVDEHSRVGDEHGRVGDGHGRVGDGPDRIGNALDTIGRVLRELRIAHPGLYDRLVTEQNTLRPHVNIFVDGENIRFTGGLDTAVAEGSEIFVLPAISGG